MAKLNEYSRELRESYLGILNVVYGYKEPEMELRLKNMIKKQYPGDIDTLKWKYIYQS